MKKAAQVVLLNEEGLVLAVSRKNDHDDFGLIGGKMDPEDESVEAAAIRETKEETGLDITDLQLVFAMHRDGFMGHTYLAKYSGVINHNEPHVVKWVPFQTILEGSFGQYNEMVASSLDSLGIKYKKEDTTKKELLEKTFQELYKSIIESQKNGQLTIDAIEAIKILINKSLERFKIPNSETKEDLIGIALYSCNKYFNNFKDTGDAKKCYFYFKTVAEHAMFSNCFKKE